MVMTSDDLRSAPARSGIDFLAYLLALAFIFTIPWEAGARLPGVGSLTKALGVMLLVVWVISALLRGSIRGPVGLHVIYFAFLIWAGLTLFSSIDPPETFRGFFTLVQLFAMMVIIWDLFDRMGRIEAALQVYVFGAYISAFAIIQNFLSSAVERFPAHQRFQALGFEVDGIALLVATAAPAAWYLATGSTARGGSRLIRLIDFAYVPVATFALVLTGTRGAVLASIPTILFVIASMRRTGPLKRVVAIGAIVAAVMLVVSYAPQGMLERIGSIRHELTGSGDPSGNYGAGNVGGRTGTWSESFAAFLRQPFTGVGLDAHRAAIPSGKEAHNVYLSVLTETGVVGAALFALVLGAVFVRVRVLTGWTRRYWYTQLAVLFIGGMSLSIEDNKSPWIFIVLAVAAAAAAEEEEEELRGADQVRPTGWPVET